MKLTEQEKEEVRKLYSLPKEKFSRRTTIASLARLFKESERTIRIILNTGNNGTRGN